MTPGHFGITTVIKLPRIYIWHIILMELNHSYLMNLVRKKGFKYLDNFWGNILCDRDHWQPWLVLLVAFMLNTVGHKLESAYSFLLKIYKIPVWTLEVPYSIVRKLVKHLDVLYSNWAVGRVVFSWNL